MDWNCLGLKNSYLNVLLFINCFLIKVNISLLFLIALIDIVLLVVAGLFVDGNGNLPYVGKGLSTFLTLLLFGTGVAANIALIMNKSNKYKILPWFLLAIIVAFALPAFVNL
jgi:hypothetical protein